MTLEPIPAPSNSSPICLACHGPVTSNSGRHVFAIASELAALGYKIALCVPKVSAADPEMPERVVLYDFERYLKTVRDEPPALVHLWTPRELMQEFYRKINKQCHTVLPYVVHLEDNETLILQDQANLSAETVRDVMNGVLAIDVPAHLTHPLRGKQFLEGASGVTALISSLVDALPASMPRAVFWPGFDPCFALQPEADVVRDLRSSLGIPNGCYVTAYTGNVHSSNVDEVRSLYIAVAIVNRMGLPLKLVRTGTDYVRLAEHGDAVLRQHAIDLGMVPQETLPALLHLSDILVQPGRIDDWNSFRVPSKLPEYLASARPVILPRVNLGTVLKNEENALVLEHAIAETIASTLLEWLPRKSDLEAIGSNGAAFAKSRLTWCQAADLIHHLYSPILATPRPA